MKKVSVAVFLAGLVWMFGAPASAQTPDQKIGALLDDSDAVYVSLPEEDFRALGDGFDLPDGGRTVTELADNAPGGAFDPRDLTRIPAEQLGYRADWVVERYTRYNLEWDIAALRLTSLDPEAADNPWIVIINGGAANFYEFFIGLKNEPGWAQYLAQKLNVMIVTIPGNFKYGGWEQPVEDVARQPAYLLDRDLSMVESKMRHVLYTNALIMQGLKALIMNHTEGDILIVGHSTSGELAMLAYEDADLALRLRGRFLGWGSGGAARVKAIQAVREGAPPDADVAARAHLPLDVLERRNPAGYSRGYSGVLNPFYEPGMSMFQVAERWLTAEARRRANFKQQLQNWEHSAMLEQRARVEVVLEEMLEQAGNPWGVNLEDVNKDLFVTHYTRMDGFSKMVWMTARRDTNHWEPEDQMRSPEVFFANEYRIKNPDAAIRLINWDLPMTHYGHLELPRQLAGATLAVVRWLGK
ncbi:MAG: hypothetical protein IID54_02380 [Proteobacteria bacterium]|nr:hypothetical protein [Pseudomonadota bacterium]